jgi:hypothetical protein
MICHLCWIEINDNNLLKSHFESKQHSNAVEFKQDLANDSLKSSFYCEICSIYATGPLALSSHLGSEKHCLKLKIRDKFNELNSDEPEFKLALNGKT